MESRREWGKRSNGLLCLKFKKIAENLKEKSTDFIPKEAGNMKFQNATEDPWLDDLRAKFLDDIYTTIVSTSAQLSTGTGLNNDSQQSVLDVENHCHEVSNKSSKQPMLRKMICCYFC
ncbi:hypothetical protein M9H77_24113 [Catharanthus roseus]|uniref:Uncharacterized protein n=1 Tax=Catharanthus roseus TaxID=4058 RepID=A0ACC0AWY3_CATRO|nr:hypothetical protein M9H77_24113 [Catharanthus roseus]